MGKRAGKRGFGLLTVVAASVTVGCASVPDMENKLQTLQFYPNMYVVQAGDTLDTIAFRYRLDRADLQDLNPGVPDRPAPGARINVRPGTELSGAVRSAGATGGDWAPAAQPRIVQEGTAAVQPAIVSPTRSQPPIERTALRDGAENTGITVVPNGDRPDHPREEIIAALPGTLATQPVPVSNRSQLDADLQVMVSEWQWPTDGQIAREFAPERIGGQGVDIAGVPGQDVRAAKDGTVVYSGRDLSGGGNLIIVRHDNDLMTTYSHADNLYVAEDDQVFAGDPIASLGWNEKQESVLRFEVRRDGNPLNPLDFLPSR